MKKRRTFFGIGFAWLLVAVSTPLGYGQTVRWDIISVIPILGSPGGVAFARGNDGSTIRLTGSGTFIVSPEPGVTLGNVTGGGTWQTFTGSAAGVPGTVPAASGTYIVTGLVHWEPAPTAPPPAVDPIGNPAEAASGLAVLRISYSDGSRGILTISCRRQGIPITVFEGITASKGAVTFFNPVPDVTGIDANRTLFHVSP